MPQMQSDDTPSHAPEVAQTEYDRYRRYAGYDDGELTACDAWCLDC